MAATRLLAQMTVVDLESAMRWYTKLFGRGVDARPMEGLVEWHLAPTFGVQVWADAERAGRSTMVLDESDLDGLADRLTRDGIDHAGIREVTASRVLTVTDPDGNDIIFTGR
ncbi:putative enzyme related to lactoylglutathione lyase [Actinoplanes octamycinicus]|uniref:Putative enzyme related to lactoylglutathione lyase n=1 Tax=Actinoplanes octamycinicus TaxID=135948 RepID=A0A7W7M9N1_9ACTN|nr:VOC family protein [Actinoplanes octamycinicus]MBB4741990.1 putative enzyme related to lactoylglutathione lyase [Actinoplanes octamycinicus]GIE60753.1 glyoxalase [Actinoplanes octamycinicus]